MQLSQYRFLYKLGNNPQNWLKKILKIQKKSRKNYLAQIYTNNTNMECHVTDLTIYGNITSYMIQNRNFELNAMVMVTCDRSNHIWKCCQFMSKKLQSNHAVPQLYMHNHDNFLKTSCGSPNYALSEKCMCGTL